MSVVSVPARIHLAGNPSDGYGGAVLSTVVPGLAATVRAEPAPRFSVSGPARVWDTIAALRSDVGHHGHDGGDRLVTAALVTLDSLLPADHRRPPLSFDWSTTIPRSVGLGGSSAIVVATMRAALHSWGLEVPPHELAEAALVAETEQLGIAAGIADRVAQVYGTTVLTDCREPAVTITPIPVPVPLEVTLAWSTDAAEPSGTYHHDLRQRLADAEAAGDRSLADAMAALADQAEAAAEALIGHDLAAFAQACEASLRGREALGSVPAAAMAPVPALRDAGAAVNFAGSGGALVIVGDPAALPTSWQRMALSIGQPATTPP